MPIKLLYTFLFYFVILTAQGNVLAVYEHKHAEGENGTFTLAEQHLYGASRIGMTKPNLALNTTTPDAPVPTIHYELTNHLGNVMAVITDEPTATETPAVESLTDYYPFGMTMPGRSYNAHTSRHGFTGHEKESDLAEGIYTTEYRLYDARVGRWLSVDPLFEKYVGMSPYNYCMLNPVMMVDPDGKEVGVNVDGETFVYNPTIKENRYSGNNEIIGRFVSTLNKMNSTRIGNKLLKSLHESGNKYIITNQASSKSNTNATVKSKDGVINKMGVSCKLLDLSHELFHSYQYEKGQGGASIFNEIEAYTFSERLVNEYNETLSDNLLMSNFEQSGNFTLSQDNQLEKALSIESKAYERAAEALVYENKFDKNNFFIVQTYFRTHSSMNLTKLYDTKYYKDNLLTNKSYLISIFY